MSKCENCDRVFVKTQNSRGLFCSLRCWGDHLRATKTGRPRNTEQKFWNKVNILGADDCWEWRGQRDKDGYGQCAFHGSIRRAHRLAFRFTTGEESKVVCHRCDNPACCNPHHLFGGTQTDNIRDRDRKGRMARGQRGRYVAVLKATKQMHPK
jgi:hypothetical protein